MSNDNRDGDAISRLLSEAVRGPVGEKVHAPGSRPALASHEFTVPGFVQVNQNDTTGRHWSVKDRMKRSAADVIGAAAMQADIPLVSWTRPQVRRVRLAFAGWPGSRIMPDPNNLEKFTLDALASAFLIVDDSGEWCECPTPILVRSEVPRLVIVLEDIEYKPGRFTSEDQLPQMRRMIGAAARKMGVKLVVTDSPIKQTVAVVRSVVGVKVNRAMRRKGK